DVSEIVKRWVNQPEQNLGLVLVSFDGFDVEHAFLEIGYEGKGKNVPEQVSSLKAVHHDGQTFLVFKELKIFKPPAETVVWVAKFMPSHHQTVTVKEPGQAAGDVPRLPAVTTQELRDLQGLKV